MSDLVLFVGALISSLGLTGLVRLYALRGGLIDIPNQRGSHERATPRGGGLSIVVTFIALLTWLFLTTNIPVDEFYALLAGGSLIGGIGFLDDHQHISAAYRFFVHLMAASIAVYLVGGFPPLPIGTYSVDLGWAGHLLSVVFLVWLTNVFNFMDGLDGIAALETIFIATAAFTIGSLEPGHYLKLLELGLAAACLGFLFWNWPPARIFMGDVGSGFLGIALGTIAIISVGFYDLPIWCWLILAGVFVIDATVTLVVRIIEGERWYTAHNSHAYQKAARRLQGHRPVTLAVLMINLCWLLPIAYFASMRPEFGWWLTLIAWSPLIALAMYLRAGQSD